MKGPRLDRLLHLRLRLLLNVALGHGVKTADRLRGLYRFNERKGLLFGRDLIRHRWLEYYRLVALDRLRFRLGTHFIFRGGMHCLALLCLLLVRVHMQIKRIGDLVRLEHRLPTQRI